MAHVVSLIITLWLGGAVISWLLLQPFMEKAVDKVLEEYPAYAAGLDSKSKSALVAGVLMIASLTWFYYFPKAIYQHLKERYK